MDISSWCWNLYVHESDGKQTDCNIYRNASPLSTWLDNFELNVLLSHIHNMISDLNWKLSDSWTEICFVRSSHTANVQSPQLPQMLYLSEYESIFEDVWKPVLSQFWVKVSSRYPPRHIPRLIQADWYVQVVFSTIHQIDWNDQGLADKHLPRNFELALWNEDPDLPTSEAQILNNPYPKIIILWSINYVCVVSNTTSATKTKLWQMDKMELILCYRFLHKYIFFNLHFTLNFYSLHNKLQQSYITRPMSNIHVCWSSTQLIRSATFIWKSDTEQIPWV